jgi:long-chain acyl-CoA synthetase
MREYATPSTAAAADRSLLDDVVAHATHRPGAPLFATPVHAGWADVSAAEFWTQVRAVGRGLVAAGVEAGDRVLLLSRTRYEWTLLDFAILLVGGVTVPVYETSTADHVAYVLSDSRSRFAVVETTAHLARLAGGPGDRAAVTSWVIDEDAVGTLTAAGADVPDEALDGRRADLSRSTLATIVYTSGTTGRPRGCPLTHGNLLHELETATEELDEVLGGDDACTLLFLPLAHVFARVIQFGAVHKRVRLGHCPDIRSLPVDLASFRPTFLLSVPRVFEKLFNSASQQAAADGRSRSFDRAAAVALAYSRALDEGGPGPVLRARHRFHERLVYAKVRAALGGRCAYAVSGGAPLGERLGHFYRGIGVTVLEGYGLTETTAAVTLNTPETAKIGTVGRPLGGVSVRVAEDGELLVKGGQVFGGYWCDPDLTAEVLHDDWLSTGDLAEIDDEGFVRITGRKKEILVTAGGKNVAPSGLEDHIRSHLLVSQCLVVGDGRPFIAALITLDPDAVGPWARDRGKPDDLRRLADDADLHAEIQLAVDEANRSVSQAEAVRRFAVLPVDWTEEDGQLTPSLKLRRSVVTQQFQGDIERLYLR